MMTLEEMQTRGFWRLTDEEHEILCKAVNRAVWDAAKDAFGVEVFEELFGESPDDDFKDAIADDLLTNIGGLLKELGPLASSFVAERHFLRDILEGNAAHVN